MKKFIEKRKREKWLHNIFTILLTDCEDIGSIAPFLNKF